MDGRLDRRSALRLGGVAVATLAAGCTDALDGSDETDETDDGGTATDTPVPPAEFRKWIPASAVGSGDAEIAVLDTDRAADEFPQDEYEDFDIAEVSQQYGVTEDAIDWFIVIQEDGDVQEVAMTGRFDPDDVVQTITEGSDAEAESYGDYQVVADQIAVGDSAIVVGEDYADLIDIAEGEGEYLGERDDDWDLLLNSVQEATLIAAGDGWMGNETTDLDPERSGLALDAIDESTAHVEAYLHYESASDAEADLDTAREDASGGFGDGGELKNVEQDGNRIIVEAETESFDL